MPWSAVTNRAASGGRSVRMPSTASETAATASSHWGEPMPWKCPAVSTWGR